MKTMTLNERLRHHVTGAIERGEAEAIAGMPAPLHTPGPWAVSHYMNITSRNGTVAKTEQMPGNDESEQKANANLIAACPDMFDALQAIVDAFGDQDSLLIDQCKAALAKAKGEAK